MTEESPNKNREEMRRDLVAATVDSAAEAAGIKTVSARLELVNQQIGQLIGRLASLRSDVGTAQQNVALASEAVKNASHEYQTASVTVTSKSQDMKQISPAVVPERPIRPSVVFNTAVGFLLGGFVFASIAVLVFQSGRRFNRERAFIEEDAAEVTFHRS